jgi:enoyl-CoA hydratase/carnithine racemase
MSSPDFLVHIDRRGPVAVVTRDNPPVNALTLELCRQFRKALDELADDSTVRAVVLTAAGSRSFGAGSDIAEFEPLMDEGSVIEKKMSFENETFSLIAKMPQPVIAAMNGSAFGGGLEIALACDLIVGEAEQLVGLPEVQLGLFPGSGGCARAFRRIGESRTKELVLFGDPITTERAYEWGLINAVVDQGQALDTALEWATELANRSASGLRACKQSINIAMERRGSEQAITDSLELFRTAFHHPDAREGARAFLAKRPPSFPSLQTTH